MDEKYILEKLKNSKLLDKKSVPGVPEITYQQHPDKSISVIIKFGPNELYLLSSFTTPEIKSNNTDNKQILSIIATITFMIVGILTVLIKNYI